MRVICVVGMVGCAICMEVICCFVDLFVDLYKVAWIGGARVILGLGSWEGVFLLCLKFQFGDEDVEVVGECCLVLLVIVLGDGLEFVMDLLSFFDSDV